jgi:uncharacterized membrane protein (DUF485 family)
MPQRGQPEEHGVRDWREVESSPEFRALVDAKRRFILPATVFFIVYYFSLPVLVGYWPELMDREVVGHINLAYLFALSQFVMAWILMAMYVSRAKRFDGMVAALVSRLRGGAR